MYICRLSPYEGAYSGDSSTLNRVPMLAGIPVTDDDTDTLVEFLRHAEFPGVADKLERALASESRSSRWSGTRASPRSAEGASKMVEAIRA